MAVCKRQRRPTIVAADLDAEVARIATMSIDALRQLWRERRRTAPPPAFTKDLLARALTYRLQEACLGGLDPGVRRLLSGRAKTNDRPVRHLKVGSVLVREYQREVHQVLVVPGGFCWQEKSYASLSTIAREITGTSWNGPRFFGLRGAGVADDAVAPATDEAPKLAAGARTRSAVVSADQGQRAMP